MENKRYIDKVIGSLVRSTKIDYENNLLSFPFPISTSPQDPFPYTNFFSSPSSLNSHSLLSFPIQTFYSHCRNTFGLTEEETEYVWEKYRDVINKKIKDGE